MIPVLKHLFKLQFLIILLAVFAGVYYPEILEKCTTAIYDLTGDVSIGGGSHQIYSKEVLSKFTGETEDDPIYLSILGSVYDVTKGKKHYGPGCSYSFFAGRDASKSFISGEFEDYNENSDDVMSLSPSEILSLYEWKKFYDKEYVFKGLSEGRFYKRNGAKTKYHHMLDAIVEQARVAKETENQLRQVYPSCNIEWSEEKGTRVWCTSQSGGQVRDWIGLPRKYYEPGKETFRCACVQEADLENGHFEPYENCDLLSHSCFYQAD